MTRENPRHGFTGDHVPKAMGVATIFGGSTPVFRIRRIYDDSLPVNQRAIEQVQEILRSWFPHIRRKEVEQLPEKLRNPFKHRFRSILFVADDLKGRVKGFAFLLHDPVLSFCYLDYISSTRKMSGRGIGGALYQRIRREALDIRCVGIFMECLPDDPRLSSDPEIRNQNAARLKFYERFGARPIINTSYETPLHPGDDNPPYLVFDDLGKGTALSCHKAREIVRAILERKYSDLCPEEYIRMVVDSFRDDPVQLREFRYQNHRNLARLELTIPPDKKIALVVNDKHHIHHIRERGYVESPIRIKGILKELEISGMFENTAVKRFGEKYISAVHDPEFVNYLKKICERLEPGRSVYPYIFPIRNATRPPRELPMRAGYYCIDTFTPLNGNAYLAARRAVDCALTAASQILGGQRLAYVLVRPPGHHAERRAFGGFCYFNSAAVAAHYFSAHGKVAILDIDYHHGNGQQNIFYARSDVLTVSIHGHPRFAYPYFSGFEDEKGEGAGEGFNFNFPLAENIEGSRYREVLNRALHRIRRFHPRFLIVALGLDTARGDPTGSWNLTARDFEENGYSIGSLKLPILIVQEGGYNIRNLGKNARHFFNGVWKGMYFDS